MSVIKGLLPKNPLFRLLFINGMIGIAVSFLVLGGLFWTNVGNLRGLVMASSNPLLPILMLAAGLIITLGSVAMGSAIMMLKPHDDDSKSGGKLLKIADGIIGPKEALVPVPVRSKR